MLYKKLKHLVNIGYIYLGWQQSNKIAEMYEEGKLKIQEGKWGHNEWTKSNKTPFKLGNLSDVGRDWLTHDGCRSAKLYFDGKHILIKVTMYNGDNYDGRRKEMRWEATFTGMKATNLSMFKSEINSAFKRSIEDIFLSEEEFKKEIRMHEIENDILDIKTSQHV